ncbi:MAG: PLP-dependent aminotransferase family protein [Hyphomicrobiales bacterium]
MQTVRDRTSNRSLMLGDKLPSIRKMAEVMGVSNSTVVDAYDRLVADGVIRSKRGSGYFVSAPSAPLKLAEIKPKLDREVDPFWVSRQSLDAKPDAIMPGCGWLPSSWMPNDALRKAMRKLARSDNNLLTDYGSTKGSIKLRRWLSRQSAAEGLPIDQEQVLLTTSGTQAIDLICRLLLKPGDCVLVDDPCYFNFQALLKAHQVKVVGVPFGQNGSDIDVFRASIDEHRPRIYITNSALHNPTGGTISAQLAHKLIVEATAGDVVIVEDNIFADFEPEPSTRMAVLDGLENVIRIGSFSKTLSASVRCGYISAKPEWIEALVDLQVATNFGGPSPLASELVYLTLSSGSYRKHMEALRRRLDQKRTETANHLEHLGLEITVRPRGGFYLWCKLPDGLDSTILAKSALEKGVVLAPGNVFSPSLSKDNHMRFNVSQMEKKALDVVEAAIHHLNKN